MAASRVNIIKRGGRKSSLWLLGSLLLLSSLSLAFSTSSTRKIAVVTGGTRGIGSGIAEALAEEGYDLLLTYNTNKKQASDFTESIRDRFGDSCKRVECVGGDISLPETRDAIFACLDSMLNDKESPSCLSVMVHNAGQYVGITADNSDGIDGKFLMFGNGSLLDEDGKTSLGALEYYHRMYGTAFVDLCERSLARMDDGIGGALLGISSPGVTTHYYGPDPSYSMPGSGKCLMEYSMRIFALQAASRNVSCNVIIPGFTKTEAWTKLAQSRGMPDEKELIEGITERLSPRKKVMAPRELGDCVVFLASNAGRWITGLSLPYDGGVHLKL